MAMTFSLLRATFGSCVLRGIRRSYLSSAYSLSPSWEKVAASVPKEAASTYSDLDKKLLANGKISGVDLDRFAHAVEEEYQLEELEDLLHRFRRSSATVELMESTVHAVIRNYLRFDQTETLLRLLDDRLNYGLFPDFYSVNVLMNHFLVKKNFRDAAKTASVLMLQEDFSNPISAALTVHSCLMYLKEPGSEPWNPPVDVEKTDDDEVKRVRVPYLTLPYNDEHFDLRDPEALVGKTLMLSAENVPGPLSNSAYLIGAALFKKPKAVLDKLGSGQVASDVRTFVASKIDDFGDAKAEIEQKLDSLAAVDKEAAELSEIHLKATVAEFEQKEMAQVEALCQDLAAERRRSHAREIAGKEILARIHKVTQIKEDLRKEEQLLFFFDLEDKLNMELRRKIPRHFKPPPPHIQKFIEKTKKRAAKKSADYVPPEV